jgi:hypothetical protein
VDTEIKDWRDGSKWRAGDLVRMPDGSIWVLTTSSIPGYLRCEKR